MKAEDKLKEIEKYVNDRIKILSGGGCTQKRNLLEVMAIRTILTSQPITAAESEMMAQPPAGNAPLKPIDMQQRSREIYEKLKAEGKDPEAWQGNAK